MKLVYILLVGAVLLSAAGIASAANDTDISEMVDMSEVKASAFEFWDIMSDVGYLLLSAALVVCVGSIFFAIISGSGISALGSTSKNADTTNKGRSMVKDGIYAVVSLIAGIMVVVVVLGML